MAKGNYTNPALRDLAENAPCMFRVEDVCNGNPATTVWCHSNESRHGKGKSLKAHDCFGAFGCSACHTWYDHGRAPREEKRAKFQAAMDATWLHIWTQNLIRVGAAAIAIPRLVLKPRAFRADGPTARPSKILPRPA